MSRVGLCRVCHRVSFLSSRQLVCAKFPVKMKTSSMRQKIKIIICLAIVLVLPCVLCNCPYPYLHRQHGDKTICCLPVFNCGPDAEVIHCSENMGKDMCRTCDIGDINPHIVSSVDTVEHRCFKREQHHQSCPLEDTIPAVNVSESISCLLYCACKTIDCYSGNNPCACVGPSVQCKENETLDPDTGDCVPCPENSYKLEAGCGPCTWNVTALLGDLAEKRPAVSTSVKPIVPPTSTGPVIIVPDGPSYNISKIGTHNQTTEKPDDGFSAAPVIAIVVILLIIAIFAAIVLVTYRKVQSNDDHSLLVKCYHCFCPGRYLEAEAGLGDTESLSDPPYNPGNQNPSKPLQHVAPLTRPNGAKAENDYSSVPFADMSMTPERLSNRPPSLGRSLEEINEEANEEEDDGPGPTSVSPLLQNREDSQVFEPTDMNTSGNSDTFDPDMTEQKTAASDKE